MSSPDQDHLRWLRNDLKISFHNKSVIDFGCGSGSICLQAAQAGAKRVIGIDLETPEHAEPSLWKYLNLDLNKTDSFQNLGLFDIILGFDIIEHLDSPWQFLQMCALLLSKEGTLILTTPNTSSWERWFMPKTWSGQRDPQHKLLFTPYSLSFLLERSGFLTEKIHAPIRKLGVLSPVCPAWGGQIFCAAKSASVT